MEYYSPKSFLFSSSITIRQARVADGDGWPCKNSRGPPSKCKILVRRTKVNERRQAIPRKIFGQLLDFMGPIPSLIIEIPVWIKDKRVRLRSFDFSTESTMDAVGLFS